MILIYAGIVPSNDEGRPVSPEVEKLRLRAKLLLDRFATDEAMIILPTIAVAEILVPVPDTESGLLIQSLSELFLCPTFDMHAADIAARLWAKHKKLPRDQQYKERHVLKADAMIIAAAKAAGATEFFSNDANCRKLASLIMDAYGLPTKPRDLEEVFIESDIKSGEGPPPRKKKPAKPKKRRKKAGSEE